LRLRSDDIYHNIHHIDGPHDASLQALKSLDWGLETCGSCYRLAHGDVRR
jgi:hypothetical protein